MVDLLDAVGILRLYGSYVDPISGKAYSPYITRGSNNVPRTIPRMPTADDLRNVDHNTADGMEAISLVLHRFGLFPTPAAAMESHASSLDRFTGLTSGTANFDDETLRMAQAESGRRMLGQARKVSQRYETLSNLQGDMTQEVMYVCEGDDPCKGCLPLAGKSGPYRVMVAAGRVPSERCFGGDLCMCQLVPVD